ncbi:MAG: flagellar hook-basal body protein [Armatimonadota bacterium]
MINGLYSAAAGMLGQLEQQDAISNNLANANTSGYKHTAVSFAAVSRGVTIEELDGANNSSKQVQSVIPIPFSEQDHSQGMLQDTANPTNLALDGPGYFVVSTGRGRELTRHGNFTLNKSGQLATSNGGVVMGQNGPIKVSGTDWSVDSNGTVRVNGSVVDKLQIVPDKSTRAASGSRSVGQVVQGQVEGSNVSVVREMVSMMTALRSYEANQKSIHSIDQTLEKAINIGGKAA